MDGRDRPRVFRAYCRVVFARARGHYIIIILRHNARRLAVVSCTYARATVQAVIIIICMIILYTERCSHSIFVMTYTLVSAAVIIHAKNIRTPVNSPRRHTYIYRPLLRDNILYRVLWYNIILCLRWRPVIILYYNVQILVFARATTSSPNPITQKNI